MRKDYLELFHFASRISSIDRATGAYTASSVARPGAAGNPVFRTTAAAEENKVVPAGAASGGGGAAPPGEATGSGTAG